MAFRFRTSKKHQDEIRDLTKLFNFRHEGIISTIAIGLSLQTNHRFELSDFSNADVSGKDIRDEVLFGRIEGKSTYNVYQALFEQHYKRNLSEEDFGKFVKLHLEHGIEILADQLLHKNYGKNIQFDYLVNLIKRGTELITDTQLLAQPSPVQHGYEGISTYAQLIDFILGEAEEQEQINVRLNDLKEFDSHHIAIAGMTGSGKTELAKDILYQIHQKSRGELKFIFFDYKGEGNSEKIQTFLKATNCEFVDVLQDGFELNPLSYISQKNERLQIYNIRSFIDAVTAIEKRLGALQKHTLQTVISRSFEAYQESKGHPSLKEVFTELQAYYEETNSKIDSLYTIIEDLSRDIFRVSETQASSAIYEKNLYLSLPKTLSDTLRQITVFLTLNYLLAIFNSCDDVTPDSDRINPLRYIIVIDEAHVYLKNKNARKILEDLLRVIRSKGVVVIMISQGASDYRTPDFDFASQVKLPICLNINDKDYRTIKSFVGTPRSEHKLQEAIDGLTNRKGIINIKEPQLISIRQFWQTISS